MGRDGLERWLLHGGTLENWNIKKLTTNELAIFFLMFGYIDLFF